MNSNIELQHIIDRHYDNISNLIQIVNESSSLINRILTQNLNNRRESQSQPYYSRGQNYNNQNINYNYASRNQQRNNFMNNIYRNEPIVNNMTYSFDDNNNSQNDNFVLRFDTIIPFLFDNMINNTTTRQDISYNIGYINEENKHDISNISYNNELLDINKYEFIENPTNDICPITRERFNNNQNVMMITSCKHIFNKSSLNIWISNNNTCPTCRCEIKQNNIPRNNDRTRTNHVNNI